MVSLVEGSTFLPWVSLLVVLVLASGARWWHVDVAFIIESILTSSISIWYAAAAKDKGRLQRIIRSAERGIGRNLPSLQDLYASRIRRRAGKIVADPSHPGHKLV